MYKSASGEEDRGRKHSGSRIRVGWLETEYTADLLLRYEKSVVREVERDDDGQLIHIKAQPVREFIVSKLLLRHDERQSVKSSGVMLSLRASG